MREDLRSNLLPFTRPKKPFGVAQMSLWFQRLGRWLGRSSFAPTACVVILINEDDQRLWYGGPRRLSAEAIRFAFDDWQHREHPTYYPRAVDARAHRRAHQRAYEAEHPLVCEACGQRFQTPADEAAHQAPGHVCRACAVVLPRIEDWQTHVCIERGNGDA